MLVSTVSENESLLCFLQSIKATFFYTAGILACNVYSSWHYLVVKEMDVAPRCINRQPAAILPEGRIIVSITRLDKYLVT